MKTTLTRTTLKNSLVILLSFIILLGYTKSYSQKEDIQFAPPDGTIFYEFTKISEIQEFGEEKHKSETEIQSYNEIKKSKDGYIGTSKLINIQMYFDDKRAKFPFIEKLTNMSMTVNMDTQGKIQSIQGMEGWDDFLRASVNPKIFDIVRSILGEDAIKKLIVKENNEGKEYYMLPVGARIPLPAMVKSADKVQVKGKECIHVVFGYNTKIKSLSWDPGTAYQNLRRQNGLSPRNIDYSNIEVTGTGDAFIDPKTSLEYGNKVDRKVKVSITIPGEDKVPVSIEEHFEKRYDYPDIVAQGMSGNAFLTLRRE